MLVTSEPLSLVDVSIGTISSADVAAAVEVNGSSRLSMPLSIGSSRKDISMVDLWKT